MKIAGRKNPGAWFRANKVIKSLSETERNNLAGLLKGSPNADTAFNDFKGMIISAGVTFPGLPTTKDAWCISMAANGIPWQVWNGVLSFTTYTKTGGKYYPAAQSSMHYFSVDVRKIVTRFLFGRRAAKDVFDVGGPTEGNPGGLPDGVKGT